MKMSSSTSVIGGRMLILLFCLIVVFSQHLNLIACEDDVSFRRLLTMNWNSSSSSSFRSSSTTRSPVGEFLEKANGGEGTKWAVLVAGSNGYENYRHQADLCHAYQVLKKGGLEDENIVVLMYDDIANNLWNRDKGVIINKPGGENVYKGVPKDYKGKEVNVKNLLAVILGDKKGVQGGSGKVVNSGPNDHIFIYYTDHGGPGVLSMPTGGDLYANDFITALKKKHASGTYKSMVIYVEACEAGSIFDGLLPKDMNIYVTTASNPTENSYATYCPEPEDPWDPRGPTICLGDLYSVSWLEDSEKHMTIKETLQEQYETVKKRTISAGSSGSHVMQYGDINTMSKDLTSIYFKKAASVLLPNIINTTNDHNNHLPFLVVDQQDAHLLYLRQMVRHATKGSQQHTQAQKKLDQTIAQRARIDRNIADIGKYLFVSSAKGRQILNGVRPAGQPLVDDWDCLKTLVATYNARCGPLSSYGKKYMRAFANMCNAGVRQGQMDRALSRTCGTTAN